MATPNSTALSDTDEVEVEAPNNGASSVESLMDYSYGEEAMDLLRAPKIQARIAQKRAALDMKYFLAQARLKESRIGQPSPRTSAGVAAQSTAVMDSSSRVKASSRLLRLPYVPSGRDYAESTATSGISAPHTGKIYCADQPSGRLVPSTPPRIVGSYSSHSSSPFASSFSSPARSEARIPMPCAHGCTASPSTNASGHTSAQAYTREPTPRRPDFALEGPLSARRAKSDAESCHPDEAGGIWTQSRLPPLKYKQQLRTAAQHVKQLPRTLARTLGTIRSES